MQFLFVCHSRSLDAARSLMVPFREFLRYLGFGAGKVDPGEAGCVCCACFEGGRDTERLCLHRWIAASRLLFGSFFLCRDGMTSIASHTIIRVSDWFNVF